jgi:hypothetical protein
MLDEMLGRLVHLIALGALALVAAGGPDIAAALTIRPGGVSYSATVVQQVDGQTFWIDLGPSKGSEPRGVVVVHANRVTRFNLTAGPRMGSTSYGSLGSLRVGSGMSVTVLVGTHLRPDGSYTLVELTTNTR